MNHSGGGMLNHGGSSGNLPITTNAGILNLDHYKYLRSLLPQVPHVIQSLMFTDLNNWECELYVNLLDESDSLKWLADFEEKTTTLWKADKDATTSLKSSEPSRRCNWIMIYRCESTETSKDCTAKLEMRITQQENHERQNKQQKYPCQVSIKFYHNHVTTDHAIITMESFKAQDIPSHLKEGFEGYFQGDMQPVGATLNSLTSTVNLSAIKPQQTLLTPPLHQVITLKPELGGLKPEFGAIKPEFGAIKPEFSIKSESQHMKTDLNLSPVGQHLDGKLNDLTEISEKLERTIEALRCMLKQNATACAAVRHFVDQFDKLKSDQAQLEDALTSFGGQWDWLVAPQQDNPTTTTTTTTHHAAPSQPQHQHAPQHHHATTTQHNLLSASTNVTAPTITPVAHISLPSPIQDIQSNSKKKAKKKKKSDEEINNQGSMDGSDSKRRKRARCGSCAGCLNRDKTQDCRQCRNCLDQKRYGGPGRLKKACIKRQCIVLSQLGPPDTSAATDKITNQPSAPASGQQGQSLSVAINQSINQSVNQSINQSTAHPVAIKSEPAQVLLPAATSSLAVSSANMSSLPASTLISWPGGQYQPFPVQVQQPTFQFTFQPQPSSISNQIQYTSSLPANTLQQLTSSLQPNTLQQLTSSLPANTLQQLTSSLQPNTLQQLTSSLPANTLQQLTSSLSANTLQQLTGSLPANTLQQLTGSLQNNTLQQITTSQGTIYTTNSLQQLNNIQQINTANNSIQQLNQAQLDSLASEAARHHGLGE